MAIRRRPLWRDERGGVLVETTVMLGILFIFILGSVDFLMAMYQWNAASKAVQVGARIAAVSTPVANGFIAITGLEGGADAGDIPPPSSQRVPVRVRAEEAAPAAALTTQRP